MINLCVTTTWIDNTSNIRGTKTINDHQYVFPRMMLVWAINLTEMAESEGNEEGRFEKAYRI
jgi:hypothetical protein